MARKPKTISEGEKAAASVANPAAQADAAGPSSAPVASPAGPDAPSSARTAGTPSTDEPRALKADGGVGDLADPAGRFPAIDRALQEARRQYGNDVVLALRVKAKHDGYRRAGIEHAGTAIYQAGDLRSEQVDLLLRDPHLTTTFIPSDQ